MVEDTSERCEDMANFEKGQDAAEEEPEVDDWQLPLAFMEKRHVECIKGLEVETEKWRMKERVCVLIN